MRLQIAVAALFISILPQCIKNPLHAAVTDSVAVGMMKEIRHHEKTGYEDDLYAAVNRYCDYQLEQGNMYEYYNGWQIEVTYDLRNNHFYKAMRKTMDMSEDIEARGCTTEMWGFHYLSGMLYSLRGNTRMAETYFRKAVDLCEDNISDAWDKACALIKIYRDWAVMEMSHNLNRAVGYIDHAEDLIDRETMAYEYSDIIGQKIILAFYQNDWERVKSNYRLYMSLLEGDEENFNSRLMSQVEAAYCTACGEFDKAIEAAYGVTGIERYMVISRVYEAAGDHAAAYRSLEDYIHDKDSITANVMLEDVNEASKDMEIVVERSRTTRSKMLNLLLICVLCAFIIVIVSLVFVIRKRNKYLRNLKRKNTELEVMSEKAQEAEKMKTIIYKNMSHEIRTPLNIISGFAQLMCSPDYELSKEEMNEMAQTIMNSSGDIVRLINNLLQLSTEVSTTYAREDDVSIIDTLSACVNKVSETLPPDVKMAYSMELYDDDRITSSGVGLTKIFSALLDNARKFSTSGEIAVTCKRNAHNQIEIAITNGGQTIPEECREKVFEPFFKVNNDKEGLGLGLSLARNTISQIGGTITLDTSVSGKTTFVAILPGD